MCNNVIDMLLVVKCTCGRVQWLIK